MFGWPYSVIYGEMRPGPNFLTLVRLLSGFGRVRALRNHVTSRRLCGDHSLSRPCPGSAAELRCLLAQHDPHAERVRWPPPRPRPPARRKMQLAPGFPLIRSAHATRPWSESYSSWTIQAAMAMRQYVHTLQSRGWVTHSMSFWLACFHICCESFFDKLFMKYSARRNGNAVAMLLAYAYTPRRPRSTTY